MSPTLQSALTAVGGVLAGMALAGTLLSRPLTVARYQATHDELTGLANRRALIAAADRLLRRPDRACGLVMLDLDEFKQVNDRYGHQGGDDLLVAVADRLRALPRNSRCARLGGDEFAVVVDGGPHAVATVAALARDLVGGLGFPLESAGVTVEVTASVGYTVAAPGSTTRALLGRADEAMYVAKSAGRAGRRGTPFGGRAVLARRSWRDVDRRR